MHDAHTEARDDVSNEVLSDGVLGEPGQDGYIAQENALQPGH